MELTGGSDAARSPTQELPLPLPPIPPSWNAPVPVASCCSAQPLVDQDGWARAPDLSELLELCGASKPLTNPSIVVTEQQPGDVIASSVVFNVPGLDLDDDAFMKILNTAPLPAGYHGVSRNAKGQAPAKPKQLQETPKKQVQRKPKV